MCHVLQIRHGKIVSFHCYYDLTTLLEYFGLAPATRQAT
jgi:ketosteroid isomerase-like protein